ncbi:MAG: hypothetical protein KIS96_15870 [Bauldia sp.]|nr:hypothetical protein [Bauldia sp.]
MIVERRPGAALAGIVLAALCVLIWSPPRAGAQVPAQGNWQKLSGTAVDIAAGADGSVFAVDSQGQAWGRAPGEHDWKYQSNRMVLTRIGVAPDGSPWGVDDTGTVWRLEGREWRPVGAGAVDIAVGAAGDVAVSTNTGSLAVLRGSEGWAAVSGAGTRVAVGPDGELWTVAADGTIARQLDDAWVALAGKAIDLAIGPDGRVVVVGTDRELYEWNESDLAWSRIAGGSDSVAVAAGPGGSLWRADGAGGIHALGVSFDEPAPESGIVETAPGKGGSTPVAAVPDRSPVSFEPSAGTAVDLAIGADGSVFALRQGGALQRWSNGDRRFNDFPGDLDRLSVAPDGRPWGVGRGRVFRHDGAAWREVPLRFQVHDLDIGADGRVFVVDTGDAVYELGEPPTRFTRRPGKGRQVAVAPDGSSYWLLNRDGRPFACDGESDCTPKGRIAQDLDIGPGGSVFIVDTGGALRRFDPATDGYDLVRAANTARVALGPRDRPWVIDDQGRVFPSAFFERDESGDRDLAIRTRRSAEVTEGDGDGGITIIQGMRFTSTVIPESAPGFPSLGHGLRDITSGHDDLVIATSGARPCVAGSGRNWVLDPASRNFVLLEPLGNASFPVVVAAERRQFAPQPAPFTPPFKALYMLFPFQCSAFQLLEYDRTVFTPAAFAAQDFDAAVLFDLFEGPLDLETDMDVTGDGFIVWTDRTGDVAWFDTRDTEDENQIKPPTLRFKRVGAGRTFDTVWLVDTESNVYQLVNGEFELRSLRAEDRALDVGVGHDNSVFIVDLSGRLKKWNPVTQGFTATSKTGVTRVAVDSGGRPIVADFPASRRVYFAR